MQNIEIIIVLYHSFTCSAKMGDGNFTLLKHMEETCSCLYTKQTLIGIQLTNLLKGQAVLEHATPKPLM